MANGDVWVNNDTISAVRMNTKTNAVGTEPVSPIAGQVWLDTANNLMKFRNAANNAWLTTLQGNQDVSSTGSPTFANLDIVTQLVLEGISGVLRGSTVTGVVLGDSTLDHIGEGATYKRVTATIYGYLSNANAQLASLYTTTKPTFAGVLSTDIITATQFVTSGVGGEIKIVDRTTAAHSFILYSDADIFRIYYGADKLTIDSSGNLIVQGYLQGTVISLRNTTSGHANYISSDGASDLVVTHLYNGAVGPFQCTTLNATGYNNSAVATTSANPWFGTPTTARAIDGTVYHNATGVTIIVYVAVILTGNATTTTNYIDAYIGSGVAPSVLVATITNTTISAYYSITFIVPNGWYYKVLSAGTTSMAYWTEQGL